MSEYPLLEVTGHDSRYIEYIAHVNENPVEQQRRCYAHRVKISTNSITAGIEFLQTQDVILGFPLEYEHYLKRFGIVPLNLRSRPFVEKIGVYYRNVSLHPALMDLLALIKNRL